MGVDVAVDLVRVAVGVGRRGWGTLEMRAGMGGGGRVGRCCRKVWQKRANTSPAGGGRGDAVCEESGSVQHNGGRCHAHGSGNEGFSFPASLCA